MSFHNSTTFPFFNTNGIGITNPGFTQMSNVTHNALTVIKTIIQTENSHTATTVINNLNRFQV